MKKIILISIFGIVVLNGCQKLKDPGATVAVKIANEWWAELKVDGENAYGPGVFHKIATYNTSANANEIWVDDDIQPLWDFKIKATADFNNLTFSADSAVSVVDGYNIKVDIKDGKILPGLGHSKTGNITDSIYMKIGFEDDPTTTYTIEGHARTKFVEDEY